MCIHSSYIESIYLAASSWTISCILPHLSCSPRLLGTAFSPAVSPARLHPLSFLLWKESHQLFTLLLVLVFSVLLLPRSLLYLGRTSTKLPISGKRYKIPIHGKCLQTLALLFKLILDLIPVILTALNSSKTTSLEDGESEACLSSGHKVTDGLTDRNHSVHRLHPALLHFHVHNKL